MGVAVENINNIHIVRVEEEEVMVMEEAVQVENVNSVEKRLEELNNVEMKILEQVLKLSMEKEEPQLSEDQLRINNQLQEDELFAMEAIYGDNVVILDREDGLQSFQINVCPEISDQLTMSAEIQSSDENFGFLVRDSTLITTAGGSSQFLYSTDVQYLPPVVLTLVLPKSYPSHLPPYFTISVQWLDSLRISSLCCMLDSIWMDRPRQEVIYQWVEWIHTSSLSYLGYDKEIRLGRYSFLDTADRRAVSESISPDIDILSVKNYSDYKYNEIFRSSLQECGICYNKYAGTDFIRLPCNHFFCSKCMGTCKEGTVNKFLCPDTKCREAREARQVCQKPITQMQEESSEHAHSCPVCRQLNVKVANNNHICCGFCQHHYCYLCREIVRSCSQHYRSKGCKQHTQG